MSQIFNIQLYFASSEDIKATPLFSAIPLLKISPEGEGFPYQYHLHVMLESVSNTHIPFLLEASISFNAADKSDNSILHYGKLGSFQIEYEDFFHLQAPVSSEVFEARWANLSTVDSIRVLYQERERIEQELSSRLGPFIVTDTLTDVYIELPPGRHLLLRFTIKDKRTRVLIQASSIKSDITSNQ